MMIHPPTGYRVPRWSHLTEQQLARAATTFSLIVGWSECCRCFTDLGKRERLGTWFESELCQRCWLANYSAWLRSHPDGGTVPGRPPHGVKLRPVDKISRAA